MDYHGRSSWLGFLRLEVPKTVETRRYGIQERLRMTLQYDLPRIGRYRLYDRAGRKGTLWRCRLCGRSFKVDSLWPHSERERFALRQEWHQSTVSKWSDLRLRLALALLRSRRNLRRARWEYAVRKKEEER